MAVAKPQTVHTPPVANIERVEKTFTAPVIDTRVTNYNTLSTFAAGSKWACDAYLRIHSGDNQPATFSEDTVAIYGQLREVRGFELIITTPIDPKQGNSLGRSFEVTGTALSYSPITWNEGDFFIADVGDGRNGVFTVFKSNRNAPYTEAHTTIEFKQRAILTPAMLDSIKNKVQETLYFDRELLRNGLYPMIREEDLDIRRTLVSAYRRLTNMYLHEFTDRAVKTLILPGQKGLTYDPHMTRFVLRTFDRSVCPSIRDVLELTVDHQPASRVLTVLDALESLDEGLLWSIGNRVSVQSVNQYYSRPYMYGIYHSGVEQVVTVAPLTYTRDTHDAMLGEGAALQKAGVKNPTQFFLTPSLDTGIPEPTSPVTGYIKRIVVDDYYIFSEAFYKDTEGQSLLESIVRARLGHRAFSLKELAEIAKYADKFDNLERYYYIPIILALIKTAAGVL